MPANDIELFQSFCRNYFNVAVKDYLKVVAGNNDERLNINDSRELVKRIYLCKDNAFICLSFLNNDLLLNIKN